jgi:mono/diheme cytochrome c family protein
MNSPPGTFGARLVVGAALLVLPAPRTAQDTTARALPDTSAIPPAWTQSGRAIFHGRGGCVACHGERLEGTAIAPTLRAHAWKDAKDGQLEAIYGVIRHGVPGTVMVAHPGGISDADAARLATYIWAVNHRGATP